MRDRHGIYDEEPPQDVFLSDDPHLALVHADMGAWLRAHPCSCDAICTCLDGYADVGEDDD